MIAAIVAFEKRSKNMRIKRMMIAIAGIMIVLGLNAIATAIEFPGINDKTEIKEPVTVAELENKDHIEQMSRKYGLDSRIVKALIEEESGWCESAEGDNGNSVGLMQIQERWHKERMKRLGVTDLYDPEQNITLGCDILSELVNKYGNYRDALSVYNSGNTVEGREYADRILSNARN